MKVIAALVALVMLASAPASALEPKREGHESSLIRAVFAQGRLWMLSDAGELSSIAEGDGSRIEEPLAEPAIDLCAQDGRPVVLTCDSIQGTQWTVRARDESGVWKAAAAIAARGDELIGMSCAPKSISVLTDARLIDFTDAGRSTLSLSPKIHLGREPRTATLLDSGDELLLGLNKGEWGGGLRRIDRASGKTRVVAKTAADHPCSGPLGPLCDPVNGIAREPWKLQCSAVAIGLVHFVPSGRIVEVCPDRTRVLYRKPYPTHGPMPGEVAFFGIVAANGALWSVGIDGIYRIDKTETVTRMPLPPYRNAGGIYVSFALPHLVVVLTSINARHSISGDTPMLVWR